MSDVEALRELVAGRSQFVSDMYAPDMLYARTVRSPASAGRIQDIRLPELPSHVVWVSAADLSGENSLEIFGDTMPIFADRDVHYVGEPIGLLVGPDQRELEEIVPEIQPVIVEAEADFTLDTPLPHQIVADRILEFGDVREALSSSSHHVQGEYRTGIQEHLYSEPQGAFSLYEQDGQLAVYSGSQWPFHVLRTVARALGLSERSCRVFAAKPGVNLDGKLWYPSLLAAQAAAATQATGRPVKLTYTREEDFRATSKRSPLYVRYTTGLDEEGRISGLEADVYVNMGAFPLFTSELLNRIAISAAGEYRVENARITVHAVRTNLPPLNACVGLGTSEILFAAETHAARMVEVLQEEPAAWRRANLVTRGDKSLTRHTLREAPATATLLDTVIDVSDFSRKHAAYELQKKRREGFSDGPARGIGIAVGHQGAGFLGEREDELGASVRVRLEKDGSVRVFTSAIAENEPVLALWQSIVSETLATEPGQVSIEPVDTDVVPDSGPATLSRTIVYVTRLIESCCNSIKNQRFRQPLPIEVRRNSRAARNVHWDEHSMRGLPYPALSHACAVVEVEVNPQTFDPTVRGVWLVAEAGRILDLDEARKTLEMGIFQAISWAQSEEAYYKNGELTDTDYQSYLPEHGTRIPEIWVRFLGGTEKVPPKGLGELAYSTVPSAYVAAVSQATGHYIDRVPATGQLLRRYVEET
jgi:CO/xanthine dehydrogenase Mo-binding subunit